MSANNKVILKGVIGAIRYFKTKQQKDAVGLSIGTRDSYKDEAGDWQDKKTVWHNDIYGFSETFVEQSRNFAKGDIVELEGQLEYRKILDHESNKRNFASIIAKKMERKTN